ATIGLANWSRMARPQPASSTRSRCILQEMSWREMPWATSTVGMRALCARAGNFGSPPRVLSASTLILERRPPMRRGILAPVVALLLTGLALASPVAALEVGQKAPDFTLAAPGGKQVKLSD